MVAVKQPGFNAGEISPRLLGRSELEQYGRAAKSVINTLPNIHGGGQRRPGSRLARAVKDSADATITLPFVQSRTLAFQLEFGDGYVRVFEPNGVYTSIEIASPYTSAQLLEIDHAQDGNTMYLWHPDVTPQRLRRYGATAWELIPTPFTVAPTAEIGHAPAVSLTLSAVSGVGVAVTASGAAFLASDVGRSIVGTAAAGIGVITTYTSATAVTISTVAAFASTSIASGAWELDLSPIAFARPSAKDPVGAVVTINGAVSRAASITLTAKTGAITITASASVFVPGDAGKVLYGDAGSVALAYTSGTVMTGTTTTDFAATAYAQGAWGITGDVFRSGDVGRTLFINGGQIVLTAYTSASLVSGQITAEMTGVVAAAPYSWSMEGPAWSATRGYPRTGTVHEQRLLMAGAAREPSTIRASRTGLPLDFTRGTLDADGYSYDLASKQANPILFLESGRVLLAHTFSATISLQGQPGRSITPTAPPQVRDEGGYGVRDVRPERAGRQSILVQRSGRKVRSVAYDYQADGFQSVDIAAFSQHITRSGIRATYYQEEPEQVLWLALNDGTLLSCTLDQEQSVIAWARHYLTGIVEWVSGIPNGEADQVWVVVRRYVDGATVRTLEWLDPDFAPIYPVALDPNAYPPLTYPTVYGCTLDAAVLVDNVAGQTSFTTLSHLEGESVAVVADGSYLGTFTVAGGAITITRASYRTLIGLPFVPSITLLTPEVSTGKGTSHNLARMRASQVAVRFLDSYGCEVEDADGRVQEIPFLATGAMVLDVAPTLFTGVKRIEVNGWDDARSELTLRQPLPFPWHVLSVTRETDANT